MLTTLKEWLNENKIYYHGTTKTRAENIQKIGFFPQHNVNITDDYEEAMEYANMIAQDEDDSPKVIEVYLKKGARAKANVGLDSMAYDSKYILLK